MAATTESSIVIDAPLDAVMATIADVATYPEWAAGVIDASVLEVDPAGLPKRARFKVSSGPVAGEYTVDYTWASEEVRWTLVESALLRELDGSYALLPEGRRTQVTYRLTLTPTMPLIGALRRRAERQIVDAALKDLDRAVQDRA